MSPHSAKDLLNSRKGQAGTISFVIGIVVLIIIVASVLAPIVTDATTPERNSTGDIVENATITGTDATVIGVSVTLLGAFIIVLIANAMK